MQSDLFANDQHDMFGAAPRRSFRPDPDNVRAELQLVLDRARAAPETPWSAGDMAFYRVVFPQMANWLPDDEARQLCATFETKIERLIAS